jgi:hypothetical protein
MTRCLENKQSQNNRVHAVNPCSASLHCEAGDVLGTPVETCLFVATFPNQHVVVLEGGMTPTVKSRKIRVWYIHF